MKFPKITVVTPSFNQGKFIEDTILSVIGQAYPNLEYIIMDGGSTDETVEIIKKYESKIDFWVTEKDKGQADAINKGFKKATGDILCWLNSDDYFLPGTLHYVGQQLKKENKEVLFGNCFHFVDPGTRSYGSNVGKYFNEIDLEKFDFVIQPASFWTREVWETVGELNLSYNFVFDWEWFIRAKRAGIHFSPKDRYLAAYRLHAGHKSGTGGSKRTEEVLDIYKHYNSSPFYKACLEYKNHYPEIIRLNYYLKRLNMEKYFPKVIKLRFPTALSVLQDQEIQLLKHMLK